MNKGGKMIYRTKFKLKAPVTDIEQAQAFLSGWEEDLTQSLRYAIGREYEWLAGKHSGFIPCSADDIISVKWVLTKNNKGYVELRSSVEFEKNQLKAISYWISQEISYGIGYTFEQQNFTHVSAGFDWEINNYELFRVKE
jgi:hypothetical protein